MKIINSIDKLTRERKPHKIYENVQELEKDGIVPVDFTKAKVGDYIHTDNGYYIPILRIEKFTKGNNRLKLYKVFFPRYTYLGSWDPETGEVQPNRAISYSFEPREDIKVMKQLSTNMIMFAHLLKEGCTITEAYKASYRKDSRSRISRRYNTLEIKAVIASPALYKYLRKIGYMSKLREELKEESTDKFLAKEIIKIIKDEDAPAAIRKFAMQLFYDEVYAHDDEELTQSNKILPANTVEQDDIEKLIGKAIPEDLSLPDHIQTVSLESSNHNVED